MPLSGSGAPSATRHFSNVPLVIVGESRGIGINLKGGRRVGALRQRRNTVGVRRQSVIARERDRRQLLHARCWSVRVGRVREVSCAGIRF